MECQGLFVMYIEECSPCQPLYLQVIVQLWFFCGVTLSSSLTQFQDIVTDADQGIMGTNTQGLRPLCFPCATTKLARSPLKSQKRHVITYSCWGPRCWSNPNKINHPCSHVLWAIVYICFDGLCRHGGLVVGTIPCHSLNARWHVCYCMTIWYYYMMAQCYNIYTLGWGPCFKAKIWLDNID